MSKHHCMHIHILKNTSYCKTYLVDTADLEDDIEPKDLGLVGLTQVKTVAYAGRGGGTKGALLPNPLSPPRKKQRKERASKSSTDLSAVLGVVG